MNVCLTWIATALVTISAVVMPVHALPTSEAAHVRVDVGRAQLQALLGPGVSSRDYGGFQWLSASDLDGSALAGRIASHTSHPYALRLGGRSFDPLLETVRESDASGVLTPANWHLVQLFGPSRRAWLQQLIATGLQPVQYIHPYTYIVWADGRQIEAAANLDFVRWTGRFIPDLRLPPPSDDVGEWLHVLVLTARLEGDTGLTGAGADAIAGSGGIIRAINAVNRYLQVMYMTLPNIRGTQIDAIPGLYAMQVLDELPSTRGEAQNQLNIGAVDPHGRLMPGYLEWLREIGHDGQGITAAVVDRHGIRRSHVDLADRLVPCHSSGDEVSSCSGGQYSDHATHVAGAIAGTGASGRRDHQGFLRGLGVAPGTRILPQQFNATLGGEGLLPGGILALFRESVLNGAQLANNSWGLSSRARGYDIPTMQVDMIVRDADPGTTQARPLLPIWAIMNGDGDGTGDCAPGSLGSPDEAKNLIAVGATDLLGAGGTVLEHHLSDLASRSGHGDACDGRRVPHLVAPGCSTDNPTAGSDQAHSHVGFCGTSMAAPNVTGAAAIFMAHHLERTGHLPSPALVKAALTAVATDLAGHHNADRSAIIGHRPDRYQGYGRLNLDAAVNSSTQTTYFDQEHIFEDSGQRWHHAVQADDPDQPMRIMLAWTDAPGHGLGGDTPAWVNDLDLSVGIGDSLYRGNVVGDGGWSVTGGVADSRNNLEGVFLAPHQHRGGRIELSVLAANIAADALDPYRPDFAAPRQDFALVCYNCRSTDDAGLIFANGFQ